MFKRLLLAAIVIIGIGAFSPEARGFIVSSWSYVEAKVARFMENRGKKQEAVAEKPNIEKELRRAEGMLANFRKVDDRLICNQSELTVAIRGMERDHAKTEAFLLNEKQLIQSRNEALKSDASTLIIEGQEYPRNTVARELESRFEAFRQTEATLKHQKELLGETRVRLNVVVEQRQVLKAQEAELQARILRLKTSLERLRAAETKSQDYLSDTQVPEVAKLKELLDQLEKRVEVNLTELEIRARERPTLPAVVFSKPRANLSQDIDAHFGKGPANAPPVKRAE